MNIHNYKQSLLDELYAPFKNCTKCPLGTLGRSTVVFGEGNPNASLMIIGEGPGRDEDEQGRPFVGRSGKLLSRALEIAQIPRESIYITNIVKCRPPGNRTPLPTESGICKRLLLFNQIKIIRPKIICTLGACALQELTNQTYQITKIRGTPLATETYTIIPTLHPAYILRNPISGKDFLDDVLRAVALSKID
jgi:DNA polymerase